MRKKKVNALLSPGPESAIIDGYGKLKWGYVYGYHRFDNDKYVRMQSEKIKERIAHFGGKLYLEFGGKLFDDYHASRVLRALCRTAR